MTIGTRHRSGIERRPVGRRARPCAPAAAVLAAAMLVTGVMMAGTAQAQLPGVEPPHAPAPLETPPLETPPLETSAPGRAYGGPLGESPLVDPWPVVDLKSPFALKAVARPSWKRTPRLAPPPSIGSGWNELAGVSGGRGLDGSGSVAFDVHAPTDGVRAGAGVTFGIPSDPRALAGRPPNGQTRWHGASLAPRRAEGTAHASFAVPMLPWFSPWEAAFLDANLNPLGENADLTARLARSFSVFDGLTTTVEESHRFSRYGLFSAPEPVLSWETTRSIRLDVVPTGTALTAGGRQTSDNRHWVGSVGAEQALLGLLRLSVTFNDLGGEEVDTRVQAGFTTKW